MRALICFAVAVSLAALVPTGAAAQPQQQDDEAQMGAQLYNQLKDQREIVRTSPLYAELTPIADSIAKVVQPKYPYPIKFYVVHEAQPNAFAAPGGNVYVTDSLFYFAKNTEELAGTLCHETSHLLHHDSAKKMKQEDEIRKRAIAATILLGPTVQILLATAAIGELDSLHYSRDVEEAADLTGSETCAAAGYNPWGLVWLFHDFESANLAQPPEVLSDHPDDQHRIDALEAHFKADPSRFARFDSNPKSATPIHPPADEAESFLR